jgi:chromosome segregation ATPase
VEAHNLKDQQLSNLRTRVAELEPVAARVPELEAAHAEKDERIEALLIAAQGTELAGHIASDSEKDAQLASRLMQLKTVEPSPSKDAEIDALRSRLQEAEYEASVAAARLRMTHDDEATKEYEIADLRLRIRELSDQLEVSQAERASALAELEQVRSEPLETPKAMAAAAGFYDSGVGQTVSSPLSLSPKEAEEAQFQDRIQEYESRIEELQHVEAHKDQEISLLRLRLADLQTLPEPLARQQIQLSAKDAELEQMRRLLDSLFEPLNHSDVALCAFGFAQARNFQNGSAEEDWLRAERQVYHNRLNWAREWSEQQGFF